MDYDKIIAEIFTALPMYHKIGSAAYKEGLENIETLAEIVGHPEKQLSCIHVAGTNGKGSVTHLLSSFYQELGLKVGLYTSPHLLDFRERIKINGEMIPKKNVVAFFERYRAEFQSLEPSFFEMTTALALSYFVEEKVDMAIIEVGLGGRLDATNIVNPLASVITNISLDHTQLLGDTLAKIASEKAGIIKPKTPVIIGRIQPETLPVFQSCAHKLHAPLYTTELLKITEQPAPSPSYKLIEITDNEGIIAKNIQLPLPGDYQIENVATFVRTVQVCANTLPNLNEVIGRAVENVLTNTHLQGRWQVVAENPLTICDTGHNSGGFSFIANQLTQFNTKELHLILGFVSDKDVDSIIALLPQEAHYTICRASVARAMSPEIICNKMKQSGLMVQTSEESVYQTYCRITKQVGANAVVYIGGSTFIVADFLAKV